MSGEERKQRIVVVAEPPPIEVLAEGDAAIDRRELLVRGAGLGAGVLLAGGLPALAEAADLATRQKRGGRFRLATGGTPTGHNFDPLGGPQGGEVNLATREMFFERLFWTDRTNQVIPWLATDFSVSRNLRVWKLKLRRDVEWHDGSRFTADDVVWTHRYQLATPGVSAREAMLAMLAGPQSVRKLDRYTVQLTMKSPLAILPQILTGLRFFVVKRGTRSPFNPPIGTGPFKFQRWSQGQSVLGVRNPNYWIEGQPYLDEFELLLVADPTARLNALLTGQVHGIAQLSPAHIDTVRRNRNLALLAHGGGAFTEHAMRVDVRPFNDNRVRQAFKYMVDRKEMNRVAHGGISSIGNDVQNFLDPDRATLKEIPQRPHDPERARALLRQAGASDLKVSLTACPNIGTFSVEQATVLKQQAREAGVEIDLDIVTSDVYQATRNTIVPFCTGFWSGRFFDEYIGNSLISGAANNETHWENAQFARLWQQYRGTVNRERRRDISIRLQRMLWTNGGYIIPLFQSLIDAHTARVRGVRKSAKRNFDLYNFRTTSFR